MRTAASVEIDRPIDEVFEYTNDNVAEWSITVVEDEVINSTPERVGSTFRCVTEDRGCRMEFAGEVVCWEPPNRSAVYLAGKQFDIAAAYQFEDIGNGRTRVSEDAVISPKGFTKVFFALFGWMFRSSGCKAMENELLSLKRLLEDGAGQRSEGSEVDADTDAN
jgi:hypothetical protein